MRLSNQAMGAIMMALQKSLLEQSDITETLRSFNFELNDSEELLVRNPPSIKVEEEIFKPEQKNTIGSD